MESIPEAEARLDGKNMSHEGMVEAEGMEYKSRFYVRLFLYQTIVTNWVPYYDQSGQSGTGYGYIEKPTAAVSAAG